MKEESKNWENVDQYSWFFHIHPSVPASSPLKFGWETTMLQGLPSWKTNLTYLPPTFAWYAGTRRLIMVGSIAGISCSCQAHKILFEFRWLLFLKMIMKQQRKTKQTQPLPTHHCVLKSGKDENMKKIFLQDKTNFSCFVFRMSQPTGPIVPRARCLRPHRNRRHQPGSTAAGLVDDHRLLSPPKVMGKKKHHIANPVMVLKEAST